MSAGLLALFLFILLALGFADKNWLNTPDKIWSRSPGSNMPVVMQLIRLCKLPAERYFNPGLIREDSEQRQRTSHKLQLCPEKYLPIVEGVIDGAIKLNEIDGKTEGE